jgi:hypothetical protein
MRTTLRIRSALWARANASAFWRLRASSRSLRRWSASTPGAALLRFFLGGFLLALATLAQYLS